MRRLLCGLTLVFAVAVSPVRAVPAAPSALTATVSGANVSLSWTAPGGALLGYRLDAGTGPGLSNAASIVVGTTPAFSASAVPPGTYYVRVRAIAADGESPPSNEIVVTVGGGAGCPGPPSPPSGLAATIANALVGLSWSPPIGGCGATGYLLQAGSAPGAANLAILPLASTTFSVTAPSGNYYVRVLATNAFGTSAPSNELIITVGGAGPAGQVSITDSATAVRVTSTGNTIIIGEVINRSAVPAVFIEVAVTLRNAAGAVIGADSTFVRGRPRRVSSTGSIDDSALAPGELGCFYLITSTPLNIVAQASLNLTHATFASTPLTSPVAVINTVSALQGTQLRFTGQGQNTGAAPTFFNMPVLYVQRSDGLAVGCDYSFVNGGASLGPGQTGSFDFLSHAPANVTSVRSWMQWQESGPDALASQAQSTYTFMSQAPNTEDGKRQAIDAWEALHVQRRDLARQAGQ